MTEKTVPGTNFSGLPIRADLLDAEAYHWEEGLPEGRLRRFDMNLSAVPPAWYGRAVAMLGRVAVNNYPDATPYLYSPFVPNEFPTLPATSRRFLLKLCHGTHSQLLHYRPY